MIPLPLILEYVIDPVLARMDSVDPGVRSESARWLLLGTGLKESHYETREQRGGPARSPWQIERPTHDDVVTRYFGRSNRRLAMLAELGSGWGAVAVNDWYACAIARGVYRFRPGALPDPADAVGMGKHWKKYYNTTAGAGTADSFTQLYAKHILPMLP